MYKLNSKILEAHVDDGQLLVLDPDRGEYFELNSTSSFILDLMKKGFDQNKIVVTMCQEYDCTNDQALSDLLALVEIFKKSNILA